MAQLTCELEGVNIVLLGHFNPSIFQPAWFAAYKLIRDEEATAADVKIIHPDIAAFTADWLGVEVTQTKFHASTTDAAHYEPLRDLVLGIFTLLEHTRFDKMGLNRNMHYKMASIERWHAFGHFLAPKKVWDDVMKNPGLRTLVLQGFRGDPPVRVQVKVEPSSKVKPGIYISTNEHHEASGDDAAGKLMTVLKDSWQDSQAYAKHIAEHLLSQDY